MKLLEIDAGRVRKGLVKFVAEHTRNQGFDRVVLGLSGGLDSTVCAGLAAEALGRENCLGVFMPHAISHKQSLTDAREVAESLQLPSRLQDITGLVASFEQAFPNMTRIQLGNVMARCRMIVLYQISSAENALVLGTSNKSEILLGYGTLHGDLACAFDPLGDLYKTQVRQLAKAMDVPENILKKTPSADLWRDQSDEGELGMLYAEADRFLVRWIDRGYTRDELIAEGFSAELTDTVMRRVDSQKFKRRMPVIPKLSDLLSG